MQGGATYVNCPIIGARIVDILSTEKLRWEKSRCSADPKARTIVAQTPARPIH